jgi:hypothetical protein
MIGDGVENLLFVLVLLQLKHFICDGPLQTIDMVRAKGHYGRALGFVHAGLHGLGAAVALLLASVSFEAVLLLAVLDFAFHYHVDFIKEQIVRRMGWTTAMAKFWWALSADQTMHQLTYLLIAYLAIRGV